MMPTAAPPKAIQKFSLFAFDERLWKGLQSEKSPPDALLGADEVGRGSLIGPVVAAAVHFEQPVSRTLKRRLKEVDDSKKLTPQKRAELYERIREAGTVGIGQASLEEIDAINIHHASLLALHRAVELCQTQLTLKGYSETFLLLDGKWPLPQRSKATQLAIIKGDGQSACIAAASIMAKHWRDDLMKEYALEYPQYDWHSNMGYATPPHKKALLAHGPSPYHRRSFKLIDC